jgi:hypothetical protein
VSAVRRLVATVAAAAGLLVGSFTLAPPPAGADTVPLSTTNAICAYIDPGPEWNAVARRTIHYGYAHVTQCAYRHATYFNSKHCRQYVWNYSPSTMSVYSPPNADFPYCW